MTFHREEPNFQYRALRLVSEQGRWELGFSPYHQGCRLRMGPRGLPPSVLDLCLGHDPKCWARALVLALKTLDDIPEGATSQEIDAAFPWSGTRPDLRLHWPEVVAAI
jgi:hypothetical protein